MNKAILEDETQYRLMVAENLSRLQAGQERLESRMDRLEARLGTIEEKLDTVLRCLQDRL